MAFRGNDQPAPGLTRLSLVQVDRPERARDRDVQVGVVQQDVRALPAELQRDALHGRRGQLADSPARFCRTGERNSVDQRVRHQLLADVDAAAGKDVEDARRDVALRHGDRGLHRAARRVRRRLEHDRVSHRERREDLPRRQHERCVERHDRRHDTVRLAHQHVLCRKGELVVRKGFRQTDLRRDPDQVARLLDAGGDHHRRVPDRHARVARF